MALWQELLGVRPIGVTDDFFTLGGHSLLAVGLVAAVQRRFGRALPVAHIFTHRTVERMALEIAAATFRADVEAASSTAPHHAAGVLSEPRRAAHARRRRGESEGGRAHGGGRLVPARARTGFTARLAAWMEAHHHALARYIVKPYAGSMVLLRARDREQLEADAPELSFDWSALCAGEFRTEIVPGTHATMVYPPHVDELARVLGRVLALASQNDVGDTQGTVNRLVAAAVE